MVKTTPSGLMILRAKLGLSQKQFADLIGVSRVTVSRWENGEFEAKFTPGEIRDICRKLGLSFDDLPDSFGPTPAPEGSK